MEDMTFLKYYLEKIDKERNIYELADLLDQNRKLVSEYSDILQNPQTAKKIDISELESISRNNVVNFISGSENDSNWEKMNAQFLNYHKSLSVYELMNSTPIVNYISLDSGVGLMKNIRVADIGGGTGHTLCSFFQYPESIDYYLVDPNLRLLHDQFYRMYPKLSYVKMGHVLAKAEALPFVDGTFDLTMSMASIDHMEDYKKFIEEAKRITKPGGVIFISSHLDIPPSNEDATKTRSKLFNISFFERLARYLYFRKHSVKSDDHTFHFDTIDPIIDELEKNQLIIDKKHVFKKHFYIVAHKPI